MGRLRIKNTNESRKQKATAVKQDCFLKKTAVKTTPRRTPHFSAKRQKETHRFDYQ